MSGRCGVLVAVVWLGGRAEEPAFQPGDTVHVGLTADQLSFC
jgi:hypothetical protein